MTWSRSRGLVARGWRGKSSRFKGQITDRDGVPMSGARIEIWQCDVNGKYLHPGDNRSVPYDQGFQGFGHDITDVAGNYAFRTIKPTKYPGAHTAYSCESL